MLMMKPLQQACLTLNKGWKTTTSTIYGTQMRMICTIALRPVQQKSRHKWAKGKKKKFSKMSVVLIGRRYGLFCIHKCIWDTWGVFLWNKEELKNFSIINDAKEYCAVMFQYTCLRRLMTRIQFWNTLYKRILRVSTLSILLSRLDCTLLAIIHN